MNTQDTNSNTITIQKTSKECKAAMLIGGTVALLGCGLILMCGVSALATGTFLVIAGFVIHTGAKTVAWWNHG